MMIGSALENFDMGGVLTGGAARFLAAAPRRPVLIGQPPVVPLAKMAFSSQEAFRLASSSRGFGGLYIWVTSISTI